MLYEMVWVLYVLGIILFLGIGVIGLALASSASSRNVKTMVIIFSVLSIALGIYFHRASSIMSDSFSQEI